MIVKQARNALLMPNKNAEARGEDVVVAQWWSKNRKKWLLLNDYGAKPTVSEFVEWYAGGCEIDHDIPEEMLSLMEAKYNAIKMGLL